MTVRYAVVGAGWISQIAFLPGVGLTKNSQTTALVSGNTENARKLAEFHDIPNVFSYDQYDEMLASDLVDAVYIALPNSMHADYAIRAARAGKHVMVEKPLATSEADCKAMIQAAEEAGVFLMTAYRLHNEPGTVEVLEQIRQGNIGDPRLFTSVFSFQADPTNHRLQAKHWGGPLQDIGIYCLNAARHVFASEPIEVSAMTSRGDDPRFTEVEEAFAATLVFPHGRVAQFCASFGADNLDTYRIVGTSGEIAVERAFEFQTATRVRLTRGDEVIDRTFPHTDHFAGQTEYFSECILTSTPPEPDGREGLADVAALLALEKAARTGATQKIESPARPEHPVSAMVRNIPPTNRRLLL